MRKWITGVVLLTTALISGCGVQPQESSDEVIQMPAQAAEDFYSECYTKGKVPYTEGYRFPLTQTIDEDEGFYPICFEILSVDDTRDGEGQVMEVTEFTPDGTEVIDKYTVTEVIKYTVRVTVPEGDEISRTGINFGHNEKADSDSHGYTSCSLSLEEGKGKKSMTTTMSCTHWEPQE